MDIDTLRYSLRSGQRHLGAGFGSVVLITPDLANSTGASQIFNKEELPQKSLSHSFKLLNRIRGLLDTKNTFQDVYSSKLSPPKGSSTADDRNNESEDQTLLHKTQVGSQHMRFLDEVGDERHYQRPSWLSNDAQNEPILISSLWSLACKLDIAADNDAKRDSSIGSNYAISRKFAKMGQWIGARPKVIEDRSTLWTSIASYACKQRRLPTFNPTVGRTIASEYRGQGGAFIMLEQHHFFGNRVDSSDFYSPLYGPIFRLSNAGIGSDDKARANAKSPLLQSQITSNNLLGNRFGYRDRAQMLDLPAIIVQELVQEVRSVWGKDILQSSLQRTSHVGDIDLVFLYVHYTIERHREALLWSFFVARHDVNGDDKYSSKEVKKLFQELGFTYDTVPQNKGEKVAVYHAESPRMLQSGQYIGSHLEAGVWAPALDTVVFTSQQGYLGTRDRWAETNSRSLSSVEKSLRDEGKQGPEDQKKKRLACDLADICFAPFFSRPEGVPLRPSDVFKHIAFSHWGCGDCSELDKTTGEGKLS
jgi:hypothetical protein